MNQLCSYRNRRLQVIGHVNCYEYDRMKDGSNKNANHRMQRKRKGHTEYGTRRDYLRNTCALDIDNRYVDSRTINNVTMYFGDNTTHKSMTVLHYL